MRTAAALALGLAAALLCAPLASAHTTGSPPVSRSGFFILEPCCSDNSTVHVDISAFDLPVSGGDTLEANWSANGGAGPAIRFWIHSHGGLNGTITYFDKSATYLNTTWAVPRLNDNSTFMVMFDNPTIAPINVTYSFLLMAPPADFGPLFFLFPGVAGVAFGWYLYIRAGKPGGKVEDDGADAAAGKMDGAEE